MELVKDFIKNFFELANLMSIYLLFGLIFAGVLKELLPSNFITKHLGKKGIGSIIKATIFGIPMPVCSCSVIPLAKSLQKQGASAGAVQSFLIATPITGVDSIFATYSFFGWFFTLYRVATSIIIAIIAGILQDIFVKEKRFFISAPSDFSILSRSCQVEISTSKKFSIKRAFKYAFDTLFSDIAKSLFIGLVVGALFATFLPKELIESLGGSLIALYLITILISLPMYVCATSSLPIGASMLLSGVSLGAVFIFLTAGPATNSVTMSVVKDMYGKRALLIYLSTITLLSIIFGAILDLYLPDFFIEKVVGESKNVGIVNYIATAILLGLTFYYWRRK
ncbi:MAG: SO_0444 family Cu/Zn efflux transporter [Epsilonproteobacteria bacterium]|nr:SO_0444 family Cu/Zn efflux transporter [Campylobacterota bacterium]